MELLTYLGFTTFGPFLGSILTNILSNRADNGLRQMETVLAAKLQDGHLPANHDLRQAVLDALRQALRGLALALAASHQPASPFLRELRKQLTHPQDRKLPVTTLLHVKLWTTLDSAERSWIDRFAQLIEDKAALDRLAARSLELGQVDALLDENPPHRREQPFQHAVAQWLDVELVGVPGKPDVLDDYLQYGWPVDEDGQRVSLYTAWCWFFRETVKDRPKVFNLYVAATLAELKQQLSRAHPDLSPALARLPAPALDDFRASLAAGFAELKTYLDARFDDMGQRLDAIRVTQAAHTGLLHDIRDLIGGFPALWQSSRRWRYGMIGFAALVLGGGVYLIYQTQQNPQQTAAAVVQSFDAKTVAARLRAEIEERFQRDKAQAIQAGQHWEALLKLEKQRDTALAKVDDVIATIEQGLAGKPDPLFAEASRILQTEGTDAALGYLGSHKAERQARAARDKAGAEAAEEKLRQDAQALFLEADLRQTRYEWEPALAALREAAEIAPRWWETRFRLGKLLRESAHYAEAEPQLQKAVALAEQDADRANAMNELAFLYHEQSRWAEAEPLFRQALAVWEKSLGSEHPKVATALNNLAQLLQDTNRLAEAEPQMRRALGIDEKSFGPEHPKVAIALNNLATLLQNTNRRAEAEPLMRRVVAILEKSLGPEHPNVAVALNNLAQLLQATNRLAEAEPLMRQALALDEKS